MTWPHQLTHPTTPYTHPWVGESPQISNLQTEWKYLDSFKYYWILTDWEVPWGGLGVGGGLNGGLGMMWGWQGQCRDDRDNVGMTGTMWRWQEWHGDDGDNMGKTPSIDPPIHPPMGRGVSANHKSSNRIELSRLGQDLFDFLWFDMVPPINQPNHPPTHQTIHPPVGGGVSIDFKSSNGIKISQFVQVLLNFYWFTGSPLGRDGGAWVVKWEFRDDVGMTGTTCMMTGMMGKTPLSW